MNALWNFSHLNSGDRFTWFTVRRCCCEAWSLSLSMTVIIRKRCFRKLSMNLSAVCKHETHTTAVCNICSATVRAKKSPIGWEDRDVCKGHFQWIQKQKYWCFCSQRLNFLFLVDRRFAKAGSIKHGISHKDDKIHFTGVNWGQSESGFRV